MPKKLYKFKKKPLVLAICNNKGGVGKTTCNIHLVCRLLEMGYKVLGIDLEFPGYFTRFFNKETSLTDDPAIMSLFKDSGEKGPDKPLKMTDQLSFYQTNYELADVDRMSVESIYNFKANLAEAAKDFDFVVIDTPPLLNNRLDCCLSVATHIIGVIEPDAEYALDGFGSFLGTYTRTRKFMNPLLPKLPFCFFNMFMGTRPEHQRSVEKFFTDYTDGFYSKSVMKNIDAVSKASKELKPMWKIPTKKHFKDEFLAVYHDIFKYVEKNQ